VTLCEERPNENCNRDELQNQAKKVPSENLLAFQTPETQYANPNASADHEHPIGEMTPRIGAIHDFWTREAYNRVSKVQRGQTYRERHDTKKRMHFQCFHFEDGRSRRLLMERGVKSTAITPSPTSSDACRIL